VQLSSDNEDVANPSGARSQRLAPNAPLARRPAGALIGRVGQSAPLFIGGSTNAFRIAQTGRLYLSVNDDHLDDNRGEFRVVVNVRRAPQ
jgi:hypothetical protein